MTRQAYCLDRNNPLGRQSAGAGFLEAYLRYAGQKQHQIVVARDEDGAWFHREARKHNPNCETVLHGLSSWGDAGQTAGAIHLPGPGLDEWAWKRMPWGDTAFSLIGLVHTLSSRPVQWGLGQFATAPVRPWDALICTSKAAKTVVEGFLERQEQWLKQRIGATKFERPNLPIIPLGIHLTEWTPPKGKVQARQQARYKLHIKESSIIILIAGRLDLLTKFHPETLLRILAELQSTAHPDLELLVYGEAPNSMMKKIWQEGAMQVAPNLKIHWIKGQELELAGPVRWAADIFISLADNPQETFGITPLEAMAAELPCIVSDWDGYRDTVVQPGEGADATGFRITTRMVEGLGQEESEGLLNETLSYDLAMGRLAQGIAVDPDELRNRLDQLITNTEMRNQMGTAGRRRVEDKYEWPMVFKQWEDLLNYLHARRLHSISDDDKHLISKLPPWLSPCSQSFGCFASQILANNHNQLQIPNPKLEQDRHNGVMNSWDRDLLTGSPARRQGWWLKQGLIKY